MRALLDVNVLIALFDDGHALHRTATAWFAANAADGWASCPITQNGCVRILSNAGYPNSLPVDSIVSRLAEACANPVHEFWPDDISLLDARRVDPSRVHGPKQLTDVYLLALAVKHGGRLVSFDAAVARAAAVDAGPRHLLAL